MRYEDSYIPLSLYVNGEREKDRERERQTERERERKRDVRMIDGLEVEGNRKRNETGTRIRREKNS